MYFVSAPRWNDLQRYTPLPGLLNLRPGFRGMAEFCPSHPLRLCCAVLLTLFAPLDRTLFGPLDRLSSTILTRAIMTRNIATLGLP